MVNSLDILQFSTITSTIEKMVSLPIALSFVTEMLTEPSYLLSEPSFVSISSNSPFVDNLGPDACHGCLFRRMDAALDQIDGQSHDYEKNFHFLIVHGGHPAVSRTDKRPSTF